MSDGGAIFAISRTSRPRVMGFNWLVSGDTSRTSMRGSISARTSGAVVPPGRMKYMEYPRAASWLAVSKIALTPPESHKEERKKLSFTGRELWLDLFRIDHEFDITQVKDLVGGDIHDDGFTVGVGRHDHA